MIPADLPETNIGLIALIVLVAAHLAQTVVGQRKAATHSRTAKATLTAIKDQVANGHTEPLRTDLDRVLAKLEKISDKQEEMGIRQEEIAAKQDDQGRDIRGLRTDVGAIRGDVRDARKDTRDLERRVVDFSKREHPGAAPL